MAEAYQKGTLVWLADSSTSWVPGTVTSITLPTDEQDPKGEVTLVVAYDQGSSSADASENSTTLKFSLGALNAATGPAGAGATSGGGGGTGAGGSGDVVPPLRNPPVLEQVEDLGSLSNLNEPSVLHAIATRYAMHLPYTYSGIVLVALNPFSPLSIYGPDIIRTYSGRKKSELEPHLFAIAEEALDCMRRGQGGGGKDQTGAGDQTIVVSGESGAGKTVSAKFILRYFASVGDPTKSSSSTRRRAEGSGEDHMSETEKQILASNPIMEAFGNAKTTRNDNSSRFGKYIEVLFDNSHEIVGARIRTYLLERSRLVYQPEIERNYHIFYQLLAGAPSKEKQSLSLTSRPSDFAYLAGGGPSSTPIQGVDDAKEFRDTQTALSTVGIAVERQWDVFKILAALLHLGNIKITQARTDAVLADDDAALELATNLLGLPKAEFKKWTIKKQLTTRSEKIVTALGSAAASVVRDSVAKFVYSCLFDWLVGVVNESLCGEGGAGAERATKFIGVLDIYGFEHFKKNSFEQFCINWANEKLQQEFNAHVFKLEQEEYIREQIDWTFIDFADNQACIDIIEGKMGILTLLDEESRLPAGADASLATKLHSQLAKPENKDLFKKPRFNQNAFTIAHYAHDVTYDVEGFIEKNRDTVPDEHLALLQASSNEFLKEVLDAALAAANTTKAVNGDVAKGGASAGMVAAPGPAKRAGAAARKPTLGSIFKYSLISLMDTINNTNVHYIRCIKPNEAKKAWLFEPDQVLSQLRACGVLETIKISCAGYPSRWPFADFLERYYPLIPSKEWQKNDDAGKACTLILQRTLPEQDKYQIGLTKVFLRAGILSQLEAMRKNRLDQLVTLVQKNIRRRIAYKQYQAMRKASIRIQTWWRGVAARKAYEELRRTTAAVRIQKQIRGWLARREYVRTREAIVRIQAVVRGHLARKQAVQAKTDQAVTTLQRLFRGCLARRQSKAELHKIVLLQSLYRRKLAVRELRGLKAEAKSASKFREISYQLENKVFELTQNLQKRSAENRELTSRLSLLEQQVTQWQNRHDEASARSKELEEKLAVPSVPMGQFESAVKAKSEAEDKLRAAMKNAEEKEAERIKMAEDLSRMAADLENKSSAHEVELAKNTEVANSMSALRSEVATLKEQISRHNTLNALTKGQRDAPSSPTLPNGLRQFDGANSNGPSAPRRRQRRHSTTGHGGPGGGHARKLSHDEVMAIKKANGGPRAVSVMFPHENGPLRPRDSNGLPTVVDSPTDEIARLLTDEVGLDEDVLGGLINDLRIPAPSSHNPPLVKEVIFPAHLISLISNEMWKLGMIPESERFLANVMQSIQAYVMQFKGEDVIQPGIFWLANVHETLSFVCIAENDALQGIAPGNDDAVGGRPLDWELYERLVSVVKKDLDSLEYNIYHTFMLEIKRVLQKLVIPALIESQALPGFVTSDGHGRMFSKFIGMSSAATQPTATMDDILNLLNNVWKCLKSYYMEESVMQQVVTELLKLIGQVAFNDLIMRRNFCSWKRAMQIQYNITRIEEWCKAHDIPEGSLQLEHLMQATKLLQLKKATMGDIEILFDICWILSPSQIQKLIAQYHKADYEAPITTEIQKAVAARVKPDDKTDQLLLAPETDEVGPYQLPTPRDIPALETYVPAWLNVPLVRRLATFVA